jgi:hypothetical protein
LPFRHTSPLFEYQRCAGANRSNADIEFNSKIACRVGRSGCARTASGHADAEYANPLMKSRRRIVFPRPRGYDDLDELQQGFATNGMGLAVSLHGSNPKLLMSALGQKRTSH